mgnify:CR=1 FL=1
MSTVMSENNRDKASMSSPKYYGAIDVLRTIAAVGIIMIHISSNNQYQLQGFMYEKVIPFLLNFLFLFMTISAFSVCCGYYEKITKYPNAYSDFYKGRMKKVLPIFSVLILMDIIVSPSVKSLYEAFADLTLLFGLLPNAGNIEVIGVGWFIGLIFVFYLCFPFFCFLLETKGRAWFSFGISLLYLFACKKYFRVGITNILYSGCFLLAGGLIYIYKTEIEKLARKKRNQWIVFSILCVIIVFHFTGYKGEISSLLISSTALIYALMHSEYRRLRQAKWSLQENRFTKFFSKISLEVYLSHMMVFRVIEKLGLNVRFGDGWNQYWITFILVLTGTVIFACIMNKLFEITILGKIKKNT